MPFTSESFSPRELANAEAAAFEATQLTGPVLLEHFGTAQFTTKTNERDWVTQWDGWAEEVIKNELKQFSSAVGFIGEEGGADERGDVYWTVDPIDGTSHFVRGNDLCTTMIALVDHDVPVVSIIHDFVRNVAYTALAGQGSFRDLNKPLCVSDRPLTTAYIEVYSDENTTRGKALREDIEGEGAYLLRNASAGHTMASVARGGSEAFVSVGNPFATLWDIAPGALLIHEAGGIVRNIGQEDYRLSNFDFIASNKVAFESLKKIVHDNVTS